MKRSLFQSLGRLLTALAIGALPVLAQTAKDLPALSAVTRDLKGGETHSYRIDLTSGQFLHALVEQYEIDVITALFTPDGKQFTESDSPNDRSGSEPITLVAPVSGRYRVDIKSSDNPRVAGRYEIKILALREATEIDKKHAAAQRLYDEASKLTTRQGAPPKRAAIEKLQQALPLFEAAGDTYRRALTLLLIGITHYRLNEVRNALDYFEQTLPLAIALRDTRFQAGTHTYAGGMLDILGDVGRALDHFQQALKLARDGGWRFTEGIALSNVGKIYSDLSDWQQALLFYEQALPVFRSLPDAKQAEAVTLGNIGMAYSRSGEQEKALDYLQQSLPLIRAGGDKHSESQTLINIGRVYRLLGQYQKARTYCAQAQVIQKETGNRAHQADTLAEIGLSYSEDGQPEKAVDYLLQAVQLQHSAGNLRREGVILTDLGEVYNRLHQPDKALEQLTQSLSILRGIGDLSNVARTLASIARAEFSRGNLDDARKHIEESLALIETVRARSTNLQMRASYRASVENAYEVYIDVLMQQHAKDPSQGRDAEAFQANERGRARNLLQQLSEARVDIRRGVDTALLEKERDVSQVLNAKAQREMQVRARKDGNELATLQKEISALEDQYQQVQAAIRQSSPQYAALTQPQPLSLKEIQQQLDADTLLLEYSLGNERSYLWVVAQDSLQTYVLPNKTEIEAAAQRVSELLVARSVSRSLETPAQRTARIAQADSQFQPAATDLSRMILLPAAAELFNKRLAIVADGALQYVPFAALSVTNHRPLILDHEVVSLPSASAFAVQRQNLAHRELAPKTLAVIADPVFSTNDPRVRKGADTPVAQNSTRILEHVPAGSGIAGQLSIPRLPFTRWEADQILAVARNGSNLKALDFRANRAIATGGELSKYRYVHFATHGYLDPTRAGLSAIVLSLFDEQGKPEDGFLRTHDVYNLKLPAELVVLSACETGLGKEVQGEGLEGLTRAFMYAGARRLVVSLWNVNDKATAMLMQRLYTGMLRNNKTPAAALRAAQIEMLRSAQWQSPYYWAPFVMQGEWR